MSKLISTSFPRQMIKISLCCFRYYRSLPPVSKTYGVACLMTTSAYYLQLYDARNIALDYGPVFKSLQVCNPKTALNYDP